MYRCRMIVTDLDGTLLTSDKIVTQRSLDAFARCRGAGIKIAYATGRGDSSLTLVPQRCVDGRVVNNGSMAYDGGAIAYECLVPHLAARPLLISLDKRGLKVGSQRLGRHYANFVVSDEWSYIHDFVIVDFATHDIDAEKIYVDACTPDDADFIRERLPDELYLTVSVDRMGMIMHRRATKSLAVEALARRWGIDRRDIIAFGDDMNDIDLLKYAGAGVAMGNALDEAKAAADVVCGDNDSDGLAIWIEENLL